jgi:hypothetical protein
MPPPETESPPPVAAGEGQEKSDSSKRLNRYGTARRITDALLTKITDEQLLQVGINPDHVRHCGSWLRFRNYYTVNQHKLTAGNFCHKHLICSLCAILRGSRLLSAYVARMQLVQAINPRLLPIMVTTSVRNGDDLDERLTHLRSSLKTLQHRRLRANQPSVMHEVAGGVYSIEITNKGNGWHPHAHAIWMVDKETQAAKEPRLWGLQALSPEWHRITGDSFIVDARPIEQKIQNENENPYLAGFCEVLKYACKPAELGPARILEALPTLTGQRLVGAFGCFYGIKEPTKLTDDLDNVRGLPFFEYLYRFICGRYQLIEVADIPGCRGSAPTESAVLG